MGLIFQYKNGQTPISEEAKQCLLVPSITTQGELDQFEQRNISLAHKWLLSQRVDTAKLTSEGFIRKLHHEMYGQVWSWAGNSRTTETNIGVPFYQISIELKQLLDDAKHWFDHEVYDPDELAIRFKHRLVSIHCFPNGNGRHSRLIADLIVEKIFDGTYFSWGGSELITDNEIRKRYIHALQEADRGSYDSLIAFARS